MVSQEIRVLVIDPSEVVQIGLRATLDAHPLVRVAAQLSSISEAVGVVERVRPSLVIVEPRYLLNSELDLLCAVFEHAALGGIVFSSNDDWRAVAYWIEKGCKGYVPKRGPASEILKAVLRVAEGKVYISSLLEHGPPPVDDSPLSTREREILVLVAKGYTSKQIAEKLFISKRTVENHRERIRHKIAVSGRADMVQYAEEHGLLQPD